MESKSIPHPLTNLWKEMNLITREIVRIEEQRPVMYSIQNGQCSRVKTDLPDELQSKADLLNENYTFLKQQEQNFYATKFYRTQRNTVS